MADTRYRFLAGVLLAALALPAAFARGAGPTLYNPQTDAMSVDITFANGDEFRNVVNAKELKPLGSDAQITGVRVFLSSGQVLEANPDDALRLRGRIDKPQNQVWVVDGAHICVFDSHKFKRKAGLKCPAAR